MAIQFLPKNAFSKIACALAMAAGFTLPGANDVHAACEQATTTLDMSNCMVDELERADKELNRVWKAVQKEIKAADYMPEQSRDEWKAALLEAQRAWIKLKKFDCEEVTYYEFRTGSAAGVMALSCALEMTEARTKDLKERYGID